MAAETREKVTQAAFESFVNLPQNSERRFEWLDGEIVEVLSNPFVSVIAARIIVFISMYLMQNALKGHVSAPDGGYIIDGQIFAPDVAYIDTLPTSHGYEPKPPLLAVEVISDPANSQEQTDLRRKLVHYMRAGVVVWVVDYVARQVEIHVQGQPVTVIGAGGRLDGGEVLPGFDLAVIDIFPQADEQ